MGEPGRADEYAERYARNVRLDGVGAEGQRRLLSASALVVGAGGLGSPAILYLAAAGIGHIGIADADRVEPSNLNRQVVHRAADLGRAKAPSAAAAVARRNPDCRAEAFAERLGPGNARSLVRGFEVVLDCTDNFAARLALADACWHERRVLVSAAAVGWGGQLLTVVPAEGNPCYRCLVPEAPDEGTVPTGEAAGILGAVAGMLGAMQAVEAVKVLLGAGRPLARELLIYDGLSGTFRTVRRAVDPACPTCGGGGG